jgi:hypothetical protein
LGGLHRLVTGDGQHIAQAQPAQPGAQRRIGPVDLIAGDEPDPHTAAHRIFDHV